MKNPVRISLVIPCRNEEDHIEKCLQSILDSDYPKGSLDVIICDGMSDDSTAGLVRAIVRDHPVVRLISNPERTTPFALNMGIKSALGDIIIILGAHSEVHPGFLSANIEALERVPEAGCVGGVIENVYENGISRAIGAAMSSPFGVGNAHFRTGTRSGFVDTVAFGAYRKEVFDKAGMFDTDLARNQDDEFNYRLQKCGYKIYLSEKIKSRYYVRASFKKLWSQYFQYGYWKVYVNQKHHTITTLRQIVPATFVLFTVIGLISSLFSVWSLTGYLCVMGLYLFFAFLSALKSSAHPLQIIRIVYAFLILHLSYGIGYLQGIIHFLMLWRKPGKRQQMLTR